MWAEDRYPYEDEKPEVIQLLIEAGFNFYDHPNYMFYKNPWSVLISLRAPMSFYERLLLMGVKVESASDHLLGAVYHGNLETIDFFLKHGADVNYKDKRGRTPLYEAANKKYPDVCEFLIKAGATVNLKDTSGWTPLHMVFASQSSFDSSEKIIETSKILLSHNANINAKTNDGLTVFMLAAGTFLSKPDIVRFLLQYKPDINAVNKEQKTALILAAAKVENPNIISILLNAGANAKLEDNTGRTALDWFDQNKRISQSPVRKELKDRM